MKLVRAWYAHTAVVGLTLTWFGCGGSGVPDPGSDPNAAQEDGGAPVAAAPAAPTPAPAEEKAAPEPVALAKNDAPAAKVPASAPPAAAPAAAAEPAEDKAPAAEGGASAPSAKGDASGTTELLNLANNSTAPEETKPADDKAAQQPGGPPGINNPPGINPQGYPGANAVPPTNPNAGAPPGGMPGYPGAASPPPSGYPGAGSSSSGAGGAGGFSNEGGSSGSGPDADLGAGLDTKGPANFNSPGGALVAFLKAVQSKNRDQLAEATALRAPTEAKSESMKKLFSTIADQSISDDQLEELAKALKGYRPYSANDPKSTGRFAYILGKPGTKGDVFQRTITLRKESKGWKVVDITGEGKLEAIPGVRMPGRGGTPVRRR